MGLFPILFYFDKTKDFYYNRLDLRNGNVSMCGSIENCAFGGNQGKWASSLDETSSQLGERGGSDAAQCRT